MFFIPLAGAQFILLEQGAANISSALGDGMDRIERPPARILANAAARMTCERNKADGCQRRRVRR